MTSLLEIQSFKQIGRRLRSEREMRGLTLSEIASSCGLNIPELVRIENGELLGFKQALKDTLSNAQIYAKFLNLELEGLRGQFAGISTINAQNEEQFIPMFLRKNNY